MSRICVLGVNLEDGYYEQREAYLERLAMDIGPDELDEIPFWDYNEEDDSEYDYDDLRDYEEDSE